VLVPALESRWSTDTKKSVMIVAGSQEVSTSYSDERSGIAPKKWGTFFIKQQFRKMRGWGVINANMMLRKETKGQAKFGRIYRLSLVANNKVVHNIILYVSHEVPAWVILCQGNCKTRFAFKVIR